DPQAMRTYVEYMALHADLQWDYDEKMALPVDLPEGAVDQQPPKSVPGAPHRMSRGPSRSPSADGPSGSTGSTRAVPVVGGYLSSGAGRVSWPAMVGAMLLAAMVSGGSTAWWMYS